MNAPEQKTIYAEAAALIGKIGTNPHIAALVDSIRGSRAQDPLLQQSFTEELSSKRAEHWGKSVYVVATAPAGHDGDAVGQGVYEVLGLRHDDLKGGASNGPIRSDALREAALHAFNQNINIPGREAFTFDFLVDESTIPLSFSQAVGRGCDGPLDDSAPSAVWDHFSARCSSNAETIGMRQMRGAGLEQRDAAAARVQRALGAQGWIAASDGKSAIAAKKVDTVYGERTVAAYICKANSGKCMLSAEFLSSQTEGEQSAWPKSRVSVEIPSEASERDMRQLSEKFLSKVDASITAARHKHHIETHPLLAMHVDKIARKLAAAKAAQNSLSTGTVLSAEEPITMDNLTDVVLAAANASNKRHIIVAGSHCITGALMEPPRNMTMSRNIDLMPWQGDVKTFNEIDNALGEGSEFHKLHGHYANPIEARALSLPEGWEGRLRSIQLEGSVMAMFVDPHDTAADKILQRSAKDNAWVLEGIEQGALDHKTVLARAAMVPGVMTGDLHLARGLLDEYRRRPPPQSASAPRPQNDGPGDQEASENQRDDSMRMR